jgi:hypothetical protein
MSGEEEKKAVRREWIQRPNEKNTERGRIREWPAGLPLAPWVVIYLKMTRSSNLWTYPRHST